MFIFVIDRATQEAHEQYLKEIVGPVFEIYDIELLGSMSRHDVTYVTLHFYPEYIDLPGVCIYKFVMIH